MRRSKQSEANHQSILLCDSGGHRLGLDVEGVERLVKTLLSACKDDTVADQYKRRYRRSNFKNIMATQESKIELVAALRHLLSCSCNRLPANVVAQVHHTIGIVYQRDNDAQKAKNAFLQALWIQSSCANVSPVDLGLTKMGLALEYGRVANYHEAILTLESAVGDFQRGFLPEDHEAWTLVSSAMSTFQLASEKKRIMSMKGSRGRKKNLLTRPLAVVGLTSVKEEKVPRVRRPKDPPLGTIILKSGVQVARPLASSIASSKGPQVKIARPKTPPMPSRGTRNRIARSLTPPMPAGRRT